MAPMSALDECRKAIRTENTKTNVLLPSNVTHVGWTKVDPTSAFVAFSLS